MVAAGTGMLLVGIAWQRAARSLVEELWAYDRAEQGRLKDEAERRATELQAVLAAIADGVAVYDDRGSVTLHNDAFARLTGLSDQDVHLPLRERLAVQDARDAEGKVIPPERFAPSRALRGETVTGEEMHLANHVLLASGAPLRREGRITGTVTVLTDITELNRAREEARQRAAAMEAQRDLLKSMVSYAPAAMVLFDGRELRVQWHNESYTELQEPQYHGADLVGQRIQEFQPGVEESGVADILREVARGEYRSFPEFEYQHFTRGKTWFNWVNVPVPRADVQGHDVLVMVVEITE
jgi:PAS domain S-box-containing protein